jgi:hypothetical protein
MADDFDEVVGNVKRGATWLRVVHMVGFCIVLYVVMVVIWFLTGAQALFSIFTGSDNRNMRLLGASLSAYVSEILNFITCNSESRPFPFDAFPAAAGQDSASRGETATEDSGPGADPGRDGTSAASAGESAGRIGAEFDDLAFLSRPAETVDEAGSEISPDSDQSVPVEEQSSPDAGADGADEADQADEAGGAGETEETVKRKPAPDE